MKYKVFASQLEALVGQSPVRGGKSIKTDRKVSQNLNQLLSRVKTLLGRNTQHEDNPSEPITQEPQNSDQRLRNALTDVEKYLTDNFGTTSSAMTYEEYNNGISLTSDNPTFSTAVVILTHTYGMLNLPNNVILLATSKPTKAMTTSSNTLATSSSSSKDSVSNTAFNTSPSPSLKSTMTPPTMSKMPK